MAENEATEYEIRVKGRLASRWAEWFDGMTLSSDEDGTSVISGMVADQSALHGLLRKLSDLGVPLVSVTRSRSSDADAATSIPPTDPREGARHEHRPPTDPRTAQREHHRCRPPR